MREKLYWRQLCLLQNTGREGNGDLISDNNELIVKNDHRLRELNISPLDAFRFLALTDSLPLEWREGLKTISYIEDEIKLNLNEQTILIKTAASKIVYKELRNRTITPPTAQLKFNTKLNLLIMP